MNTAPRPQETPSPTQGPSPQGPSVKVLPAEAIEPLRDSLGALRESNRCRKRHLESLPPQPPVEDKGDPLHFVRH